MQSNPSRDRGRILKPEVLAKLEQAILAWVTQNDRRCTYATRDVLR